MLVMLVNLANSPDYIFPLSNSESNRHLELIHSDVWGPAPNSSLSNSRYYVYFIDDYLDMSGYIS